jgi:hypothetical protein
MPAKPGNVLVVDFVDLVDAKRTDFSARHESSAAPTAPASRAIAPIAVTASTRSESSAAFAAFGPSRPGRLIKSLIVVSHLIAHLLTNAPLERHIVQILTVLVVLIFRTTTSVSDVTAEAASSFISAAAQQSNLLGIHIQRSSTDAIAVRVLSRFKVAGDENRSPLG